MLTSFAMRKPRNRRRASFWVGLTGSMAAHFAVLGALILFEGEPAPLEMVELSIAEPASISVSAADLLPTVESELGDPPIAPAATPQAPPAPRPWDAPAGERDNPVTITVAPRVGEASRAEPPATDSGDAGGRPPEHAYRRDRSVLHARLDDGAAENQAARTRTSRRPASPQAVRREPIVGIGDSVRTLTPARASSSRIAHASHLIALGGEPGGAAPLEAPGGQPEPPTTAVHLADASTPFRAVGPLDADRGPRGFDVERPGNAAADRTQRAASDERHPGLTDFSRPSAPADRPTAGGHGPGVAPGAVAQASDGAGPSARGARDPRQAGPESDERTLDRRYERYKLEIRQRVHRVLEFPKRLALRLEQGETIVTFVVDVDGRLTEGPRVVKSSGFSEFDTAAVRAVSRAAPFPPMSDRQNARALSVSMPVTFDNPVIR